MRAAAQERAGEPAARTPADEASRRATARALFDQGVSLLAQEKWGAAADRFERARALQPSARITYNLAVALSRLGRYVYAAELLRELTRDPGVSAEVKEAATARLSELEPRIGGLLLVVEGDDEELEITLDGRALDPAVLAVPWPVDPGEHRLVLRRTGRELVARTVLVPEGETQQVHVALPARPLAAPAPTRPAAAPGNAVNARHATPGVDLSASPAQEERSPATGSAGTAWRAWGWIGGGTAAAAILAATLYIALRPAPASAVVGANGNHVFRGP